MAHLDEIRVEVEKLKTVRTANKELLLKLAAKIEELKTNPAELSALALEIRTNVDGINEDVVAHTPAEQPDPVPTRR